MRDFKLSAMIRQAVTAFIAKNAALRMTESLKNCCKRTLHLSKSFDGGTAQECVTETGRVQDSLPLLDCLHLLIVQWSRYGNSGAEAVLWHLDIPETAGSVNAAGFWASHPSIVNTFVEVFEQRRVYIIRRQAQVGGASKPFPPSGGQAEEGGPKPEDKG